MSVLPSMVHRSGDSLIVRSLVSGDPIYNSDVLDEDDADREEAGDEDDDDDGAPIASASVPAAKDLPDCKVKRNYTCSACDFFTQNPRVYLYHLRDVHNEKVKIYECPSCLYASKHFQKLIRHNKMVHGGVGDLLDNKQQQNRTKDDDVTEDEASQEDQIVEQQPASFKCSLCDFSSKNQVLLSRHEREEHIKTKFFRCAKCTYVTHIKARYTKHVKYHSMPMIKCDMCDFRTPYKWNLDRHCKNHNGHGAFR